MCVSWEINKWDVRAISKLSSNSRRPIKKLSQSDLDGWDRCSVKLRAYQLDGLSWLVQGHSLDGHGCSILGGWVMKWDWERLCRFAITIK